MTWIVATIIILFVIILFVYGTKVFVTSESFKKLASAENKLERKSIFSVDSEQMLLALLETKIEDKIVKDYLLNKEFDVLEPKIKPILDKLPNPYPNKKEDDVDWILRVFLRKTNGNFVISPDKEYRNKKFEVNVGGYGIEGISGSVSTVTGFKKYSYVMIDKDKKISLNLECTNGKCD